MTAPLLEYMLFTGSASAQRLRKAPLASLHLCFRRRYTRINLRKTYFRLPMAPDNLPPDVCLAYGLDISQFTSTT